MKKDGGIIENWQMHTVTDSPEAIEIAKEMHPTFDMDRGAVFTGSIVEDPTGRFTIGDHMRSSLIISYDPDSGRCETANTIYNLRGDEGGDIYFDDDMGKAIMAIFY